MVTWCPRINKLRLILIDMIASEGPMRNLSTHYFLVLTARPCSMFYDFVCSISYQSSVHPKALLHLLIGGEGLIVLFRILPTDALPDSLAETLRGFFSDGGRNGGEYLNSPRRSSQHWAGQ